MTSTSAKPSGFSDTGSSSSSSSYAASGSSSASQASSSLLPSTSGRPPLRGIESLLDEDRLSDFPENEAFLIAKQAWLELLNRVANFYELKRGDTEEQKRVMGMKHPFYLDPARATINLALP